jgi:hypothetical protein
VFYCFNRDNDNFYVMIREDFPPSGSQYEGGISDGWQYQVKFAGSNLTATLDMIKSFLAEEGYSDVPIPNSAEALLLFRLPSKQEQILMFGDNGYVHNPLKILFMPNEIRPKTLTLCLFNEKYDNHLLRFHGKMK